MGQGNPRYAYRLGELLESSPVEKHLGILLDVSQLLHHRRLTAPRAASAERWWQREGRDCSLLLCFCKVLGKWAVVRSLCSKMAVI